MSEPKRPLKVFLCHAHADKPKIRELYRYLKKRGIQPWFDEEDLVGGQDWQVEIPQALATSDATIVCITKNSLNKEGYVQKEIKFALDKALEMPEGRIFLIPVRYEECEVPPSLSRYQWINIFLPDGYEKLVKTLRSRADQIGVLPPNSEEIIPYKPLRRIFLTFIIGVFIVGALLAPMLAKGIPIIEYYLTVPTPTTTVTITPYATALLPINTVTKEPTSTSAQNSMPTEITDPKSISIAPSLIGNWTISDDWCTDSPFRYSLVYKFIILDNNKFKRDDPVRINKDGSTQFAPAFDDLEGTWTYEGNLITLIVGTDKYIGEVDGNKIKNGKIYSDLSDYVSCWTASYTGK